MINKTKTLAVGLLAASAIINADAVSLQQAKQMHARWERLPITWPMATARYRQQNDAEPIVMQRTPERPESMMRRSASGSIGVYGYITNSDNWDFVPSWVELTTDGYTTQWEDVDYWMQGEVKLDSGWVHDGKLCGYATQLQFGQYLTGYYYKEYNLADGTSTTVEMDLETCNQMYVAAYSPELDMILGFGIRPDGMPCLLRAAGSNPTQVTVVRPIGETSTDEILMSLTWNQAEKRFVGINFDNELVAIGTDGTYETLSDFTGVMSFTPYYTALCYDATDRVYYWNVFDSTSGYIYRLNDMNGNAELVSQLPEREIFGALYCPGKIVSPEAPARPEVVSYNFVGASTEGTVTYRLPVKKSGGDKLEGEITWTATLDGEIIETGTATAGAEITVAYIVEGEGVHSYGCYATAGEAEGPEVLTERYVGNDTPTAPTDVKLSGEQLSWTAVATGVHGGYVDEAAVTYEAWLDGESLGTTSDTKIAISLDSEAGIKAYQATVQARYAGKESEISKSNKFVYGSALELPVSFKPTDEEFLLMTTEDGDSDGYGWTYVGDMLDADAPCLDSDYSHVPGVKSDDWLFLPPVSFDDADAYYTLRFEAKGRLTQMSPDEFFEVKLGTKAESGAMTQTIVAETRGQVGYIDYERYFKVPAAGTYYIGFHATSAPMMFGVRLRDIKVEKSEITAESPTEAEKIETTPAEKGELAATVTMTLPAGNVSGGKYPETTTLTAKIEGVETLEVTGKPGERVSGKVVTKQGDNRLRVVVWNGETPGLPTECTVYTGIDVPLAPDRVEAKVSEDNMDMTLNWNISTTGEHNGYVDPEQVTYSVHAYNGMMGWMPIANVGKETHYEFIGEEGDGLGYLRLGVSAETIAGTSKYLTAVGAVVGHPYETPLYEDFDDPNGALIGPWMTVGSTQCQWGFADLADISYAWENMGGGAMVGIPNATGITAGIAFPKFSTKSDEPQEVTIRVWNGPGAPTKMTLRGMTYGLEEGMDLVTVKRGKDWVDLRCTLPAELSNRPWVQIQLLCDITSADQLCVIDDFQVENSTGIKTTANETGKVTTRKGEIIVDGYPGEILRVISLDGAEIIRIEKCRAHEEIKVQPGVYVVTVGETRTKVSNL